MLLSSSIYCFVYLNIFRKRKPIQNGRNRGKCVLNLLVFFLCVFFLFYAKNVSWSQVSDYRLKRKTYIENENLKFTKLLLQRHINSSHSVYLTLNNCANSRLKVSEALFILVQTPAFGWRLVYIMCLYYKFVFRLNANRNQCQFEEHERYDTL